MARLNYLKLAASLGVCQLAGIIGSVFTVSSVSTWYQTLNKPAFNPPSWVFGPVWITLYLLMGISLYLVWENYRPESKKALGFFAVQLLLNALWPILFFGMQNLALAFIEILLLLASILVTIVVFHKHSKTASYLLIPYFLWVSFATVLNLAILLLN